MSVRRTTERWSAQHSHPPGRALHPETHGAAHAHPLESRVRKRVAGGPGKVAGSGTGPSLRAPTPHRFAAGFGIV